MSTAQTLLSLHGDRQVIADAFEWDTRNWARALLHWHDDNYSIAGRTVLEVGARHGGLALVFALAGATVICSDFGGPTPRASELHAKYGVTDAIVLRDVDATNIPLPSESVDIVTFKSVLGGIGRHGDSERRARAVHEMWRVLSPGGRLLFAENLQGSVIHQYLRRRFVRWGQSWSYLDHHDLDSLFSSFEMASFATWGLLAGFGRTHGQRHALSYIDSIISPIVPSSSRYILFGKLQKARAS